MLLAPVRMLYHSWFVLSSLFGKRVQWGRQERTAQGRRGIQTVMIHFVVALVAFVWIGLVAA
jgi:membrane glycosyltransferase